VITSNQTLLNAFLGFTDDIGDSSKHTWPASKYAARMQAANAGLMIVMASMGMDFALHSVD